MRRSRRSRWPESAEGPQRTLGAADLELAEVRPVDLGLLARHRPQPLESLRRFSRAKAADEAPEKLGGGGAADKGIRRRCSAMPRSASAPSSSATRRSTSSPSICARARDGASLARGQTGPEPVGWLPGRRLKGVAPPVAIDDGGANGRTSASIESHKIVEDDLATTGVLLGPARELRL